VGFQSGDEEGTEGAESAEVKIFVAKNQNGMVICCEKKEMHSSLDRRAAWQPTTLDAATFWLAYRQLLQRGVIFRACSLI
jgi:hypothetical protein